MNLCVRGQGVSVQPADGARSRQKSQVLPRR